MKDACWTLPPFRCFGCSDALGQGRPARFCRCCGLWPCIRWTWAGTIRATKSEPDSGGWLHRYRAARRLVQRPMPGLCRRSVFKFAGATRSA